MGLQLVLLLIGAVFVGCSGDDERPDWGGFGGGDGVSTGPCDKGEQRECGMTLEQDHGIVTCYRGVQFCRKGTWSECEDGEITTEPDRSVESLRGGFKRYRSQAVSTAPAEECVDACDPYCMNFIENGPDVGDPPMGGGDPPAFGGSEGEECTHGLCELGGALDADCDTCVDTICNQTVNGIGPDSSCCTSSWDQECIDKVYTKCLNTQPPVVFDLCDFGVYSEGSTAFANRPTAGAAIGSAGSMTLGTDLGASNPNPPCSAGYPTPGSSLAPRMIVVGGNLAIPSQNGNNCKQVATPDGVWVAGSVTAQNGGGTTYVGDWHVGGNLAMNGNNAITGNVWAGAAPSGVAISGTTTAPYPAPTITIPTALPTRNPTCSGANGAITLSGGQTATRSAGNYGTVSLQNGSNVLTLNPGTYTFQTLSAGGGNPGTPNVIRLNGTAADRWDISICNASSVGSWFQIQDSTGAKLTDPKRLILYFNSNISAQTDSHFGGIVWVPKGTYTSGDRTTINGALWAKTINAGTDMQAKQISAADCEALNIPGTSDGGTGGTCPVIPTSDGGLPSDTVEPCQTGLSCQLNQRCTDVNTADACAHSKCLPGDKLSSSCDPCVARVCAANAACCASAWTQSCVDLVESTCDVTCGEVTGCAHDVCVAGSRLVQGCDTGASGAGDCTEEVCSNATYAYCCDPTSAAGWDAACVTRARAVCSGTPSGTSGTDTACSYAIVGSSVTLGLGAHNNNSTTPVSWTTTNAVPVKDLSAVTCGAGSEPTVNSNTTYPAGNRGAVTVGNNATLLLSNGTHNINSLTLTDWQNGRLTFPANEFTVNICGNLVIGAGAKIVMPAGARITINVKGNVTFGQGSRVEGLGTGADLLRLRIYAAGNIEVGPDASTQGVFMSGGTGSTIRYWGGNAGVPVHYGVLWGNGAVTMQEAWSTRPSVNNTIPVTNCNMAGLVTAPTPSCPVTTPGPVLTGSTDGLCVGNDDGWEQPSCAGFDLAAEYACANTNTVPICNHGSASFPGGAVTLGYYSIEDNPQFADDTPGTATGTCSGMLPAIAPGTCSDLTCAIPDDQDYTLMIDPNDALNECSRLDNWTWSDSDFACAVGGGESTVEYEYEADCPEDSSALWKTLSWESTVPSGSSITFSAKVGKSLADLASRSYVEVGVASEGPPDTRSCPLEPITAVCPVPLTTKLGLGQIQGQFLSIRIEADHSGGTPSIDDWTLRYTCQYDE